MVRDSDTNSGQMPFDTRGSVSPDYSPPGSIPSLYSRLGSIVGGSWEWRESSDLSIMDRRIRHMGPINRKALGKYGPVTTSWVALVDRV